METEEEDDTNDEDFNVEIRQFSSCSHRFSKVNEIWHKRVSLREFPPGQMCCCCLIAKLCRTLCDLVNCSPPGSSVHGISQARILEWAAISSSRGSSRPRNQTHVSCPGRRILYHWATREARGLDAAAAAKSLQLCPTLRDPIDGSPPGFPIPGIFQARIPEWLAISFSNAWK